MDTQFDCAAVEEGSDADETQPLYCSGVGSWAIALPFSLTW